jgi:hypothetical protein
MRGRAAVFEKFISFLGMWVIFFRRIKTLRKEAWSVGWMRCNIPWIHKENQVKRNTQWLAQKYIDKVPNSLPAHTRVGVGLEP